jgi:hypothetical protein
MWPVAATQFLKTRVSPDIKHRVQQAAGQQLVTESVWLRRLVMAGISSAVAANAGSEEGVSTSRTGETREARLYVRLRPEDQLLLRERAAAHGLRGATYLSLLARSHLRSLAPLPKGELLALNKSVADLGAIARNLNQIAGAANEGVQGGSPGRGDLLAILRVCQALRDQTKALIKANLTSWEIGHDQTDP